MEHLTKLSKLTRCAAFATQIMRFNLSAILSVKGLPVKMPSLSPTMTEGNIVKWLKNEGDIVQPGDVLCDIQTDKAVASLETDEEGILAKILIKEDSKSITVGTPIALLVEEGEDWKNVELPDDVPSSPPTKEVEKEEISIQNKQKLTKYGPSVRLLLQKFGLSDNEIPAGGPRGTIMKSDILEYVKAKNIQPVNLEKVSAKDQDKPRPKKVKITTGDNYRDIELSGTTVNPKVGVAHTYSTLDCSLEAMRKLLKELEKDGIEASLSDCVIKAVSATLQTSPEVNRVWVNNQIVQKPEVDISVAVATDFGVSIPTIRRVDRLGLEDISTITKDFHSKARKNELITDDFQNGSFTVYDLGVLGVKEFRAIINRPQCAVLAVGESRIEINDNNERETRMTATLSYDQAAISDDEAALFLSKLKKALENPGLILLGHFEFNSDLRSSLYS